MLMPKPPVHVHVRTVVIVRPAKSVKVVAHKLKCETPEDKRFTMHVSCVTVAAFLTIILLRIAGEAAGAFGPCIGGIMQEVFDLRFTTKL